jgi:hypothetical protein
MLKRILNQFKEFNSYRVDMQELNKIEDIMQELKERGYSAIFNDNLETIQLLNVDVIEDNLRETGVVKLSNCNTIKLVKFDNCYYMKVLVPCEEGSTFKEFPLDTNDILEAQGKIYDYLDTLQGKEHGIIKQLLKEVAEDTALTDLKEHCVSYDKESLEMYVLESDKFLSARNVLQEVEVQMYLDYFVKEYDRFVDSCRFKNLNPNVQKLAIEEFIGSEECLFLQNMDFELFIGQTEENLREIGFSKLKFDYTISHCQGDHFDFSAKVCLSKLMQQEKFNKEIGKNQLKLNRILKTSDVEVKLTYGHYGLNIEFDLTEDDLYKHGIIDNFLDDLKDDFKSYYDVIRHEYYDKASEILLSFCDEDNIKNILIENVDDIYFFNKFGDML